MWEIIKKGANEHILKLLLPALGSGSIWLFAQVQGLDFMSAVIVCSIVFVVVFFAVAIWSEDQKRKREVQAVEDSKQSSPVSPQTPETLAQTPRQSFFMRERWFFNVAKSR